MPLFVSIFCASLLALLFCGTAKAADLSPRQRELWDKAHKSLAETYEKLGRIPNPMSREEAEAIRVPLLCDKSKSGPLPWDVKLLLQFDQDMVLDRGDAPQKFFVFFHNPEWEMFVPDGVLDFLFNDVLAGDLASPEAAGSAIDAFLSGGSGLPAVIALSQIGGDEIPGFVMLDDPEACTPVVHFDYDDMPEIYLRNVCLLEYVAYYLNYNALPESVGDGTDKSPWLSPEEQEAVMKKLDPVISAYNDSLMGALMGGLPDDGF